MLEGLANQLLLKNFKLTTVHQDELDWTARYLKKEQSNDSVLVDAVGAIKKQTYKLFDVLIKSVKGLNNKITTGYSDYLISASIAKAAIGPATNDGWKFAMILECYRKAFDNGHGEYINSAGVSTKMLSVNFEDNCRLAFAYVCALQDKVVTGIKHNANGSKGFDILYLRNFHKSENASEIHKMLIKEFGLPTLLAAKMLFVVSWAEEVGLLAAVGAFLTLFNKGQQPSTEKAQEAFDKWHAYIQENTFFGSLLKPVYDIKEAVRVVGDIKTTAMTDLLASITGTSMVVPEPIEGQVVTATEEQVREPSNNAFVFMD